LPCHSLLRSYSPASASTSFCASVFAFAIGSEWVFTSSISDMRFPRSLFEVVLHSTSFAVHEVTGCPGEHCRTHTEHYSSKQGTARCRRDAGCSPLPRTDRQVGFDGRERAVTTVARRPRRLMQIARLRALSSRCFLDHVALLSAPEHRPYAPAALLHAIKAPIPSHRSHSRMEPSGPLNYTPV